MQQTPPPMPPPPPSPVKQASKNLPRRFGKYVLLDHLADGGMAEVYRARELTEISPGIVNDKILAIKLLHRSKISDASFHRLFLDEIRVSSAMVHPNIVQTYDYGEIQGRKYAAMEYVNGKSLDYFIELLQAREKLFPIDLSVFIIAQASQGLQYAHQSVNPLTGQRNNIVHRDISPQNIIIDYSGNVKVIDFGVAKAETNTEKTAVGMLKGKLSYMAPEALLDNIPLDHRYDQFAAALTLWDLLIGKKAFEGENVMTVTRKVFECNIPDPLTLNPNIPANLAAILMKALSKNRDERYPNMDEFSRALTTFLYTTNPQFSSGDLGKFLKSEFGPQHESSIKDLMTIGRIPISQYLDDFKKEVTQVTMVTSKASLTSAGIPAKPVPGQTQSQKVAPQRAPVPPPPPVVEKSHTPIILALIGAVTILGAAAFFYLGNKPNGATPSVSQEVKKSEPGKAVHKNISPDRIALLTFMNSSDKKRIYINNKEIAYEGQSLDLGFDSQFNLRVLGEDGLTRFSYFKRSQNSDLTKYKIDDLTNLLMDEKNLLDLFVIPKELIGSYELRVDEIGKKSYFSTFEISKDNRQQVIFIADQDSVEQGSIMTTADIPSGYTLSYDIDNNKIIIDLPLKKKHYLPTGIYQATLKNRQGEVVKEIKLLINKNAEQLISL